MRQECKHFQSRVYATGDTVRKCALDLAPEAPWRCPENCQGYERRVADIAWRHGSLVTGPTPKEPESVGTDDSVAALLDEAEDIINRAGGEIRAGVEKQSQKRRRWWWPFGGG